MRISDWSSDVCSSDLCADIDVAGLHAHYLARARAAGTTVALRARIERINGDTSWLIETVDGRTFRAATLVNAAGALAADNAAIAGARPLSITPYRRTVAQ